MIISQGTHIILFWYAVLINTVSNELDVFLRPNHQYKKIPIILNLDDKSQGGILSFSPHVNSVQINSCILSNCQASGTMLGRRHSFAYPCEPGDHEEMGGRTINNGQKLWQLPLWLCSLSANSSHYRPEHLFSSFENI